MSVSHASQSGPSSKAPLVVATFMASASPKLMGISKLLKGCVDRARLVVRGTDSQKQFNNLFSEFCRSATMGVVDVEAEMNRGVGDDEKYLHVTEASLLTEVAAYVAQQSNGRLSQPYLEQLGRSILSKTDNESRNAQQKAEARGKKRPRQPEKAPILATARQAAAAGASPRPSPALGARSPGLRPTSLSLGGDCLSPMQRSLSKLTQNPMYVQLLMPWTSPLPYTHGVAVDRVTVDRHHHHHQAANASMPSSGSGLQAGSVGLPKILDICCAEQPADMLQLWEEREAMMGASSANNTAGGPVPPAAAQNKQQAVSLESPIVKPTVAEVDAGALAAPLTFFPSMEGSSDFVDAAPQAFLVQLVHFGVSAVESMGPKPVR